MPVKSFAFLCAWLLKLQGIRTLERITLLSPPPSSQFMDFHRNPQAATPALILRDLCLLVLRLGVATLLGYFHAWQQCLAGWGFFWKQQPWELPSLLEGYHLPFPQVLAVVLVVVVVLGSLGLLVGVLARLSAGLLLACTVGVIAFNFFNPAVELAWLYALVYFGLVLTGPGCFSLAYLLNRR